MFCYEFFTKNNIFLFQGLASNIDRFVEEEVEVRHIPHLSDGDLRSLGFVTIGSRQRIRSAATAWVPQVANPDPPEVPEGTDAEQTPDVNEEEGEREVL